MGKTRVLCARTVVAFGGTNGSCRRNDSSPNGGATKTAPLQGVALRVKWRPLPFPGKSVKMMFWIVISHSEYDF